MFYKTEHMNKFIKDEMSPSRSYIA